MTTSDGGGLSSGGKIALGVVFGLLLFFGLAAVAGYFLYKKCNDKELSGMSKEERAAAKENRKRQKALEK